MQIKVREPTWLPINAYTYLRSIYPQRGRKWVGWVQNSRWWRGIQHPWAQGMSIEHPVSAASKKRAKLPNAYPRTKMSQEGCIWFQMPKGPSEQHLQRSKTSETNIGVTWCLRFLQFFVSRYPPTTRASGCLSEGILIWLALLTSLPGNSANVFFSFLGWWVSSRDPFNSVTSVTSNVWGWIEICSLHSHNPQTHHQPTW